MQSQQQSVIDEKIALDKRIDALADFISQSLFAGIDPAEQGRLRTQIAIMHAYSVILQERIACFGETNVI